MQSKYRPPIRLPQTDPMQNVKPNDIKQSREGIVDSIGAILSTRLGLSEVGLLRSYALVLTFHQCRRHDRRHWGTPIPLSCLNTGRQPEAVSAQCLETRTLGALKGCDVVIGESQ